MSAAFVELPTGTYSGSFTTGDGTGANEAPKLVSSDPFDGEEFVPVTAMVEFVFDQPMDPIEISGLPGGPILWDGDEVDPTRFDCSWSGDARRLSCEYSGGLPAGTTVFWELNPFGATTELKSAAGVALERGEYYGSFTTAGGGTGEPVLVSTNPDDGATNVPVTAAIQFVFDQPMLPIPVFGGIASPIAWTGATAANFSCSWSADARVLTCDYSGNLPGDRLITWELNPPGAPLRLQNADGVPLPTGLYSGSFTTGEGEDPCDPDEVPDTWGSYNINKLSNYRQTSSADPVPHSEDPFSFAAIVTQPAGGPAVSNATLTLPNGTQEVLDPIPFSSFFFLTESFPTAAQRETAFPAGAYTLRFDQAGQPQRVIQMTMPATLPPVPRLQNFEAAQAINPASDFTLTWNAFTGANAATDYLSLFIFSDSETIFAAPDPCVPRELPVTATSIVIPAGTLQAGRTYTANLSFTRGFYMSTNAIPEMAGYGSLMSTTEFSIRTAGGTGEAQAPRFVEHNLLPNGNPELVLTGTPGHAYTIQRATRLANPDWTTVGSATPDATGRARFEDATTGGARPAFYRATSP